MYLCIVPSLEYLTVLKSKAIRCLRNLLPMDSLRDRLLYPLGMYLPEEAASLNGGLDGCSPARSAHERMTASPLLAHELD